MRAWRIFLIVVTLGVGLSGLTMAVAPDLTRRAFSLLIFAASDHIDQFGEPTAAYVSLAHGVLGAVMAGWATALLFLLAGRSGDGRRHAWRAVAASVVVWFTLDTALSLRLGFWSNAALNIGIALLFAIPLAAIWRTGAAPAPRQ